MSFGHQLGYTYCAPSASSIATSQLLTPGATGLPTSAGPVSGSEPAPRSLNTDPSPPVPNSNQSVYNAAILNYPRVAAGLSETMNSLYSSAYAAQGYVPFGGDPSAFYSPLTASNNTDAWRNLSQGGAWPYDPTMAAYPYTTGYGGLDVRRKNATREATSTLKAWLFEHIKNPYPTKGEKIMLAIITKMTLTQVSTWFANARRRLKKENKMQWSPRNRTGDDDDDKDDSDADEGNDDTPHRKDDRDDDDEDIVVDGSSATDRISSPMKGEDSLLKDTSVGSLDISGLSSSSRLSSNHNPHSYLTSSDTSGVKDPFAVDDDGHKDSSSHNKPRIWSMADMATASQPQIDRRSPVAIAHSLINKSGYTAFSSPTSQGPHPVLNGSYASLTTQGSALSPYRLGSYLPCTSVPGMLPNFHRPSSMNVLSASTSCAAQRLGNSMLGNAIDGPRLASNIPCANLEDTATAFKPVARRS